MKPHQAWPGPEFRTQADSWRKRGDAYTKNRLIFGTQVEVPRVPLGFSSVPKKPLLQFIIPNTTVFILLTTVSCGDLAHLFFYIRRMTNEDTQYLIKIKGHLDTRWQDWFDGFTITVTDKGDTILSSEIEDQAALHGVFRMIRNLGLTIISVRTQAKGEWPNSLILKLQTKHAEGLFQLNIINKKMEIKKWLHTEMSLEFGASFLS